MDKVLRTLAAWRQANEAAKAAEGAVAEAMRRELDGGAPVDPALLREAERLRAIADERLSDSIKVMSEPSNLRLR